MALAPSGGGPALDRKAGPSPAQDARARPPSLLERLPPAVPGLVLAAVLLITYLVTRSRDVLHGDLIDTDSYMHIIRLRELVANGAWHAGFFPRDNAPYGMVLHWTKPYDILALVLAAPIAAFAGWHAAITGLAPMVGPLSIAAMIVLACWALRPICTPAERRLVGVVLAITPSGFANGQVGDADHHVLVIAAWILFLGWVLRAVRERDSGFAAGTLRAGAAAGVTATLALWVAAECILGVAAGIAALGLTLIWRGAPMRRASLAFAAAFALSMIGALAADMPYDGWLKPELDRLSILHVVFALLVAALLAAIALAPQRPGRWPIRLAVGALGTLLAAAALAAIFPHLLAPERDLFASEDIAGFWNWNDINEMKPAFNSITSGVLFMGGPAIGLVAAFALGWRAWRLQAGSIEAPAAWTLVGLMIAATGGLALVHIRFSLYPEALAALPAAVALSRAGTAIERAAGPAWRRQAMQAGAAVVLIAGPILVADAIAAISENKVLPSPNCAVRQVAAALDDPKFMGGTDLIIMTHPNQAPEVLYFTNNRTVAGPYHPNVAGLLDVSRFMTSRDDVAARAIAARRGIRYVLVCRNDPDTSAAAKTDPRILFGRLVAGKPPAWLKTQPWPDHIKTDLQLYRIVSDAPAK